MKTPKRLLSLSAVIVLGLSVISQTTPKIDNKSEIKTVKIGDQIWMASNLNVEYFSNGDLIPEAKTEKEWTLAGNNNKPAWCYFRNDRTNIINGKLYNWHAVNDPRGLAPEGWHIPRKWEWEKLFDGVGGDTIAGYKLSKKSPNILFTKPNSAIRTINESKFGAEVVGERNFIGRFNNNGEEIFFWTNNDDFDENHDYQKTKAFYAYLNCSNGLASINSHYKGEGYSVRCVKNLFIE